MNGHLERYYGFGVAGVRLAAQPYAQPPSSTESWTAVLRDFARTEWSPGWRRRGGVVLLGFVGLLALTLAAPSRERALESSVEIALLTTRPQAPPNVAPEPPPPAVAPKPPPPAPPQPESEPAPKPVPRAVAPEPTVAKQPPEPVAPARPQPARPRPAPGPPRIDPVRAPATPSVAGPAFPVARPARAAPTRVAERAKLDVAPVSAIAAPAMPSGRPSRASARIAPRTAAAARGNAARLPPDIAPPKFAAEPPPAPAKRAEVASPGARLERLEPESAIARASRRPKESRLVGVPLGSLASCVTDRAEDQLKRRVIARLAGPSHCESPAGRFRFVETKNLNAFLMWIERSASRGEADRCGELELALDCLRKGTVTEARRR